jgi:hypothetical protein
MARHEPPRRSLSTVALSDRIGSPRVHQPIGWQHQAETMMVRDRSCARRLHRPKQQTIRGVAPKMWKFRESGQFRLQYYYLLPPRHLSRVRCRVAEPARAGRAAGLVSAWAAGRNIRPDRGMGGRVWSVPVPLADQRREAPRGGLLGERGAAWAARHDPFRSGSPAGAAAGACSAASRVA